MRNLALAALLSAAAVLTASACGSSGGDDPETDGPHRQAVERLHGYGLPTAQAECVVDELGAEMVAATPSIDALVASQQYREAAKECRDAG